MKKMTWERQFILAIAGLALMGTVMAESTDLDKLARQIAHQNMLVDTHIDVP